jgi:hypothetical protein
VVVLLIVLLIEDLHHAQPHGLRRSRAGRAGGEVRGAAARGGDAWHLDDPRDCCCVIVVHVGVDKLFSPSPDLLWV